MTKEFTIELDLEYADLEAANQAMDSWLDAFGDDPEYAAETFRVRRALTAFARFLEIAKSRDEKAERHLRLLPPPGGGEVN